MNAHWSEDNLIASMTGYSRAQGSDERRRWVWETRSVNGRNLEIRCRVPQGFDRLENPARTAVGSRVKRGNVSLTLTIASERQSKPLSINRTLLAELGALVEEVRRTTGAAAPSADGLLRVRGVIEEEEDTAESEEALAALDKALQATLAEALKDLVAARAAEGKALSGVIEGHVAEIESLCTRAAERAQAQMGTVRQRFQGQLAELLERVPALSEERFAQEVALWSARPTCARNSTGSPPTSRRPAACWPMRGPTIRWAASSISSVRNSIARPIRFARSLPTSS